MVQGGWKDLVADREYSEDLIKKETTQFEFKSGSKMYLIGLDAIFVPQNW